MTGSIGINEKGSARVMENPLSGTKPRLIAQHPTQVGQEIQIVAFSLVVTAPQKADSLQQPQALQPGGVIILASTIGMMIVSLLP